MDVTETTSENLVRSSNHPASLLGRARSVFTRPRQLFYTFGEDAPWAGPLVVSALAGVLVIVLLPNSVLYEAMLGATTRKGVPVEITSTPALVANFERIRLSMGVLAVQPLMAVIIAGAVSLVARHLFGWGASFRRYFAVTTHVFLISAAGALLAFGVQAATGEWSWQPSVSPFATAADTLAGRVLASVNPFTIWMLGVLGVGIATVNDREGGWLPAVLLIAVYLVLLTGVAVVAGSVR
jgi:hypothetical protein